MIMFLCVVIKTNRANNNSNSNKGQHHNKRSNQYPKTLDSWILFSYSMWRRGDVPVLETPPRPLKDGALIRFT